MTQVPRDGIIALFWAPGEESADQDCIVEVEEAGDGTVLLHVNPRTEDVATITITTRDGWRLVRELVRAIVVEEGRDG